MKVKFTFNDLWEEENIEIEYWREAELGFVPFEGMQFNFEPDPFELFVDIIIWEHEEGILIVGFDYPQHVSKETFIEAVRATVVGGRWQWHANKAGRELIDRILKVG